jgi:hypothetical protein
LESEYLIKGGGGQWGHATPYWIHLEHRGITEMERLLAEPENPTEHFPPLVSILHIGGDVSDSTFQVASPGAAQTVSVQSLDMDKVRAVLEAYESSRNELDLPPDHAAQLQAEMLTVKAQLGSPRPNQKTIREHLSSAADILKLTVGGAAGTGLVNLIGIILHH